MSPASSWVGPGVETGRSTNARVTPWDGRAFTIRLPYDAPPWRSNDRLHWRAEAKVKKSIRQAAALVARDWPFAPIDVPVRVVMFWEVVDKRVRDSDAGQPTAKAAVDGFRDAGVLRDDRHEIVTGVDCRVEVGPSKGLRVEIHPA